MKGRASVTNVKKCERSESDLIYEVTSTVSKESARTYFHESVKIDINIKK